MIGPPVRQAPVAILVTVPLPDGVAHVPSPRINVELDAEPVRAPIEVSSATPAVPVPVPPCAIVTAALLVRTVAEALGNV